MLSTWVCCSCADTGDGASFESTALMMDEEMQQRFKPVRAPSAEYSDQGKAEVPLFAMPAKQPYEAEALPEREATTGDASPGIDVEDEAGEKFWKMYCDKLYPGEELGLDMMVDRHHQLSLSAHPTKKGAVLKWNKANPDQAVTAGDIVESVNGVSGKAEILAAMKAHTALTFRMRRVVYFQVVVPLSTVGGLGVELQSSDNGLVVKRILDGMDVKRANSRCEAGQLIAVGNVIVKVNGEGGSSDDMARRLDSATDSVLLSIYRPPPSSSGLL